MYALCGINMLTHGNDGAREGFGFDLTHRTHDPPPRVTTIVIYITITIIHITSCGTNKYSYNDNHFNGMILYETRMNDQKRHMAWKDTKNKSKQLLVGNNAVSIIQTYTMDDNEDNKDNHDEIDYTPG